MYRYSNIIATMKSHTGMKRKMSLSYSKNDILYEYSKTPNLYINYFEVGKPNIIKSINGCLMEDENNNDIIYTVCNNSLSQFFIIEKSEIDENKYHIRTKSNKYLGSPNKNNFIYCYTTKNRYTLWSIDKLNGDYYRLYYSGDKFDSSKVAIVIARYNENCKWALAYNDITIVFNKGKNNLPEFSRIVNLKNKGREGDTYLHYILHNYYILPDRVIFVQGSPFEHNETLLYALDNYDRLLPVQPLSLQYLKRTNIPPLEITQKYKTTTDFGLEYLVLETNGNLLASFHDKGAFEFVKNYKIEYGNEYDASYNLITNYVIKNELDYQIPLESVLFCYGGLFSVTKEKICKYPLLQYKKMIEILTEKNIQGGINGYILEKMWLHIFGYEPNQNENFFPLSIPT
jgi:hypothetical protein